MSYVHTILSVFMKEIKQFIIRKEVFIVERTYDWVPCEKHEHT